MRRFLPLVLGVLASGCATGRGAFDGLLIDQETILTEVAAITAPGDATATSGSPMKIPSMEARFCLQRALDNVGKAKLNTALDTSFIVGAGISLAYGAAAGAASAALPAHEAGKIGLQVSSVTTIAAAAGILALRTALSLSDVARTQRIAAAKNVDAALTIFQHYVLVDDLTVGTDDGFATCRDGDIEIAGALAGTKVNDALQKQTQVAAEAKDAKKEASTTAEVAKESVAKLETSVAKLRVDTTAKVEDTIDAAAASTAAPVKQKVADARAALQSVGVEQKKLTTARSAVALAPPATMKAAMAELKAQYTAVVAAELDASAKVKDAADAAASAAPIQPGAAGAPSSAALTAKGAAVVEATKSLIAEQEKLTDAEAQLAAKKAEAARKSAQADVAQKKLDVLTTQVRFRRAIFFQTAADVSIARKLVLASLDDLTASKEALAKLQELP